MPEDRHPALSWVVGSALLLSSLVAFAGGRLNNRDESNWFYDDLGNEIQVGSDTTLLLVVLGIILAVNGVALLAWTWQRERPRVRSRKR